MTIFRSDKLDRVNIVLPSLLEFLCRLWLLNCIQSLQLMLCLPVFFALFACFNNHQWSISASTGILLHVLESRHVILSETRTWCSSCYLQFILNKNCAVSIPSWFTLCYSFLDTEHGQFAMDCSCYLNRSNVFCLDSSRLLNVVQLVLSLE